jgi:predicted flap endonuclease-1-like 5' DNA nuclease
MEEGIKPTATAPDNLEIIEGIGPKIAAILQSAGITTFNQLAAADVDRLREILENSGLRLADPSSWGEQARLAADGDQTGLKALQDRLNAGRQV